MIGATLDAIFRSEHARLMASISRFARDLDVAEEAVAEAFARAARVWGQSGLPDNPAAWLQTVARHVAIDRLCARDRAGADVDLELESVPMTTEVTPQDAADEGTLGLVFACCRQNLPERTRMTLAMRLVLGLETREVARLLVEDEAATAQRLVRAKRELRDEGERFEAPPRRKWGEHLRLAARLVYVLFSEGYVATKGDRLLREELALRAIELGRVLLDVAPCPTTRALLALMLLHQARAPARVDANGNLLTLEEQDRTRWSRPAIDEGLALLDRAIAESPRIAGPEHLPDAFVLQAAIAALHCRAPTAEATDWAQIAALYGGLLRVEATPVVELNAAVALAMAGRLDAGLRWINELERRGELANHHTLALAKAELLLKKGVLKQAERYFRRARRLAQNAAEQRHVDRRLRHLESRALEGAGADGDAPASDDETAEG
jgi:RNA polymerase sigma-70 factor (ECF subfamily)